MVCQAIHAERESPVMDPSIIAEKCAQNGLEFASPAQIVAFRETAARLIDPSVATAAAFQRVQDHTGASVFVHLQQELVTGALALFFLRSEGLAQLLSGQLNPADPDLAVVCAPGQIAAAAYGWGFAATTREGGRAVVQAAVALRDDLYPGIPSFTRPATPDGERVILGSIGYRPYPAIPGLAWIAAGAGPTRRPSSQEAAA